MSKIYKWMSSSFPFNECFLNCLVLSESPRYKSLLNVIFSNYLWNFFLKLGVLFLILLHVKLVLRIFLRIMSKIKVFTRFNAWSKPLTKVTVRDSSWHSFCTHLDEDLKQGVIKICLFLRSNKLCKFFRTKKTLVKFIKLKESFANRVKIISETNLDLSFKQFHLFCNLLGFQASW
jgi:hypothetical protein